MGIWQLRDVDAETRRKVKVHAAQHNITMAESLSQLVSVGAQWLDGRQADTYVVKKDGGDQCVDIIESLIHKEIK